MKKIPVDPSDYQTISVRRMMDNLEMELSLMGVLEGLKMTPTLQSRFSRTITAISEDLGIQKVNLGSGQQQDITGETPPTKNTPENSTSG